MAAAVNMEKKAPVTNTAMIRPPVAPPVTNAKGPVVRAVSLLFATQPSTPATDPGGGGSTTQPPVIVTRNFNYRPIDPTTLNTDAEYDLNYHAPRARADANAFDAASATLTPLSSSKSLSSQSPSSTNTNNGVAVVGLVKVSQSSTDRDKRNWLIHLLYVRQEFSDCLKLIGNHDTITMHHGISHITMCVLFA